MPRGQSASETMTLYRPVGPRELALIEASGYREFPPRLSHQPIFYPVTTYEYAAKIAREWNATSPSTGYAGFVTQFQVRVSFLRRYPVQTVGGRQHQEYWIPAEDLTEFNANLVGTIEVVAEFHSPSGDPSR